MRQDLSTLFDPVAVTVVGASDDPAKWGHWLARGALEGPRPVHLVNSRAETVLGLPVAASVRQVAGELGLAVVAVPAAHFEAAVDDAIAMGATAIVGISSGLGESGEAGRQREQALAQRVRDAGAVMLGPNCLGVADSGSGLMLTSNPLPAGRVAFVSQSGNLSLEMARFLAEHELGFSRFASLGNQAQLTAADLVAGCIDHAGTDAIAVYCEDFRDGRRFVAAAREATDAGKPVVLLTVGSSAAAARQAQSHTGSMVSSSTVVDAACDAAGIVRVHTPQEMADVLAMFAASSPPRGPRIAVLTDGGGHASIAADVADQAGLDVPHFDDELSARVAAELPASAATVNPIDVAGGGEQDLTCFARVADVVLASGAVDALVLSGYFGGYGLYGEALAGLEDDVAGRLADAARRSGRTLAVHTMYPASRPASVLREGGVPAYRTIEGAVRSVAAVLRPPAHAVVPAVPSPRPPVAGSDYWTSRDLLADAGVPFPAARRVLDRAGVAAAADELAFPVVLKSLGLLHKSDAGGVLLGLPDADALLAAYDGLVDRLAPPACTVEEMADRSDGVELIVGIRRDPRFGPVAMVGLGGVYTEVLLDVATALAPLDEAMAERLMSRLRGASLLAGARGRPPVDVSAAARVIATITAVAAAQPDLVDLEVNPLLVTPRGAVALDARVIAG
ncbi:MAG: acetate--CoA ligase family protein [Actinomycetota bacterium]|nr:acetate--CoA ligase family protein [Actinomycetota bacterium]